jgi:hypothetical protein
MGASFLLVIAEELAPIGRSYRIGSIFCGALP